MAIQSQFYTPDGSSKKFLSSKHIASKTHVAVFFQETDLSWTNVNTGDYDLINNAVVFSVAPVVGEANGLEIRVADSPSELTDSPSDISTLATISGEIAIVAGIESEVVIASNNATNINAVGSNIVDVSSVAANIPAIIASEGHALDAANSAAAALVSETNAAASVATISPATIVRKDSDTGVVFLPAGTTAQRPTLDANTRGIRYNTDLLTFEGWDGTSWTGVGGGATGGGADKVFVLNEQVVTTDYTIPTGQNAHSAGTITIDTGVTVTIPDGSQWVIS